MAERFPTFALVNLGCKVNRVEADSFGATLLERGWRSVPADAEVAIVNTCTVTAEADRKTRKEVNRALARHPRARIFVTGCAAALDPGAYEALSDRVVVVDKMRIVEECLAFAGASLAEEPSSPVALSPLRVGEQFPTRVGVKVQDGCDNACTFCIVHVARGRARSVCADQVADEVVRYAQAGVREVVLTGIDLGAYDDGGTGLAGLVRLLRAQAPDVRLRISSIEPVTIDEALVELLATEEGMLCRHLHVPLQSGSSKVLHDMARRYTAEGYLELVRTLRSAVPRISLTTDVIVGFPGESEEDFAQTLAVARECGFSRMHLFPYSKRSGTPAAERPDQIAPEVKTQRMEQLGSLAQELRSADARSRLGTRELVLVESPERAMSESYYEVALDAQFVRGVLCEAVLDSYDEKDGTFRI